MTTKRLFPEPQNERPLPNRYTFQPTHVMRTPLPKPTDKHQYIPREMELSIPDPRVVAALVRAGWVVVEDRTVQS